MRLYTGLLFCIAPVFIAAAFILPRRRLSELPFLKNRWTELKEARWLEFRMSLGFCLFLAGAAFYSGALINNGELRIILSAAVFLILLSAVLIKYKIICNKIK